MGNRIFEKSFSITYLTVIANGASITCLMLVPHPVPHVISIVIGISFLIVGLILEIYNIVKPFPGKYKPYLLAIVFGIMVGFGLWLMVPNSIIEAITNHKTYFMVR